MRRRTMAVIGLCGSLLVPAVAQVARADGASIEEATAAQKKDAKKAYKKAKAAFDEKKLQEALKGFQRSFDIVASPNSHLMIARTLVELGRPAEAYRAYEAVVAEAEAASATHEKYSRTAKAARAELGELRSKVGLVKVSVSGGAPTTKLLLGGEEVPVSDWGKELPVRPGKIQIVVRTASGEEEARELVVDAGGAATLDIPEPRPAAAGAEGPAVDEAPGSGVRLDTGTTGRRTLAYVAGGVGIAGLATFGIFGALDNSKFADLEDRCPNKRCPPSLEGEADTGRTYQTVANVGLVVGVVGLAAGTVLYLTSGPSKRERASTSSSPAVSVGPGSVAVRGRF